MLDPATSWYELHEAPWHLLSDVLFLLTFYDPVKSRFDKCHMWLQLHGKTGQHDYYYAIKRQASPSGAARSKEFVQVSRHNNRSAVVTQSKGPVAATRDEAYWSDMTIQLKKQDIEDLKGSYNYDSSPYMIRSVILSQFAEMWHKNAKQHNHTYDTADGSMLFVHPARLRSFLTIVETRFNGGLRVGWHGTKCIPSIAADATGLNMKFASKPQNGSLYGSGLYVGFDDHIAHTYVELPCPRGNVLMVLSGWHVDPHDFSMHNDKPSESTPNHTKCTKQLNEPYCKMFQHLTRSGRNPGNYYDGAVYFQDSEIHVMGEAVGATNMPMALKATIPLLDRDVHYPCATPGADAAADANLEAEQNEVTGSSSSTAMLLMDDTV